VAVKLAPEEDEYVALEQKNIVYVTKVIVPLTPHMLGALAVGHCKASEWLRSKNVTNEMSTKWNRITKDEEDDANVNYIVTQFLEYAQSLYDIQLNNTREVLEIAIQVAQALSVCKAKGFLHRDLHFHNILFEETEDPEEINYEFPFGFRLNSRYRVTILDYDASEIVDPLEATNDDWKQFLGEWVELYQEQLHENVPQIEDTFRSTDESASQFLQRLMLQTA
jgi:serine/threonine protein kinase